MVTVLLTGTSMSPTTRYGIVRAFTVSGKDPAILWVMCNAEICAGTLSRGAAGFVESGTWGFPCICKESIKMPAPNNFRKQVFPALIVQPFCMCRRRNSQSIAACQLINKGMRETTHIP
jgi:hypothetical protein